MLSRMYEWFNQHPPVQSKQWSMRHATRIVASVLPSLWPDEALVRRIIPHLDRTAHCPMEAKALVLLQKQAGRPRTRLLSLLKTMWNARRIIPVSHLDNACQWTDRLARTRAEDAERARQWKFLEVVLPGTVLRMCCEMACMPVRLREGEPTLVLREI